MEKSASLEPAASLPENWTPTFILAQEAVSQLNGDRVKAMLSKHYYRLPLPVEIATPISVIGITPLGNGMTRACRPLIIGSLAKITSMPY